VHGGTAFDDERLLQKNLTSRDKIFRFFSIRLMDYKEADDMPHEPNGSLIKRIFEEAFNQGNLAVVDELLAPGHQAHNAFGGAPSGPQGLKWQIVMFRSAFSDLHCTVEEEIEEDDRFSAHWTMRGTHKGSFLGNPPTGRPVTVLGIIFARTENGRMIEDWTLIDQLGILQQLGLVPPAGH
jgi:predicted ester cyclase